MTVYYRLKMELSNRQYFTEERIARIKGKIAAPPGNRERRMTAARFTKFIPMIAMNSQRSNLLDGLKILMSLV